MKNLKSPKSWAAFGYLPAVESGIWDALQPAGMTALMLFIIFMYFAIKRAKHPIRAGMFFLAGVWSGKTCSLMGLFDVLYRNKYFWLFMELEFIVFTIFTIGVGCLLFRDWWTLRQKENYQGIIIKWPSGKVICSQPVSDKDAPQRRRWYYSFLQSTLGLLFPLGCGIIAALLSSAFPEDVFIMYILYQASLPAGLFPAMVLTGVYAFFFISMLCLFLWAIWRILRRERVLYKIKERFAIVQIFFSAIFIAYGAGMLVLIVFK